MKRQIKFKKNYILRVEGVEKNFRQDDLADIPEEEARELIRLGVCLPSIQFGAPVSHSFE